VASFITKTNFFHSHNIYPLNYELHGVGRSGILAAILRKQNIVPTFKTDGARAG
jgi:hypothetical protein